MRASLLCSVALLLAGCGGGPDAPAVSSRSAEDVRALAEHLESTHPDLHHDLPRARFAAARDALAERAPMLSRDGLLVELMRLAALPGPRDGHTGIFPLDPGHRRELNLYPLRLYHFPEGVFVVGTVGGSKELVGKRLVSVAGVPVEKALARVDPLVPADNEHSRRARAVQWLVTAEVLHGLGLTADAGRVRFAFADGTQADLTPVAAMRYADAFPDLFHPMVPQGLPGSGDRSEPLRVSTLAGGRAVHVAYDVTLVDTTAAAAEVRRLVRRPGVDRVVLDLRRNPGGDNGTYVPLLTELQELPDGVRLHVLISRATFSAASNLTSELERTAEPVFFGEPSGGAPNMWGDPTATSLPRSGWSAHAATTLWVKTTESDERTTLVPDVRVPYRAADFFAGRDPVLERALR